MGAASQTLNQQGGNGQQPANVFDAGLRAQLNALRAVPVDAVSLATR